MSGGVCNMSSTSSLMKGSGGRVRSSPSQEPQFVMSSPFRLNKDADRCEQISVGSWLRPPDRIAAPLDPCSEVPVELVVSNLILGDRGRG